MLNNTTEIVFHKVDNLPEKNLSNYIGHIFFTSNGGIYMCKRVEDDTFEWKPFGAVVDPDIIPTYEEILAIAQGKADDVTAEFNGKFGEISKFEDEVSITVGDLKKGLEDLNDSYTGFVTEFAVESENIRGRLTGVENGQVAVQTLLSLGLDESVLRMEGLVNGVVEKSAQIETTVDSIRTQVENISGMSSQFEQLDDKIEASVNNATANIDSRLRIAEGKIEATVSSDTFETRMSQLPGEINQTVEDRTADMRSAIAQLPEQIQLTVENETTSAAIIAKINNDKSEVKIEADKINIEGTLTVGRGIGEDTEGHDFFRVNDGGSIEARNATIYGAINAEEGHIGGLNIDSDGSLYVKEGTRDIYRLGADGKLTANNAVLTGKITADEGYIGNVEIKDGGLRNGENFRLSSDGSLTVKNASVEGTIEAEGGHIGELNIDTDGSLYVKNNSNSDVYRLAADGKLTAKNVDLTGKIEADRGLIGDIIIENGGLKSNSGNFNLTNQGILTVKNANISGTVTADMGTFGCISVGTIKGSGWERSVIEGSLNENCQEVNPAELEPDEIYYHHGIQISPEVIDIDCTAYKKKEGSTSIDEDEWLGDEYVRIGCIPNTDIYDLNGVVDISTRNDEGCAIYTNGVVEAGGFRRIGESGSDLYQEAVTSPFKNLEVALVFNNKTHFKLERKPEDEGSEEWYVYVDGMRVLTNQYIRPHGYTTLTVADNIQNINGVWQLKWGINEFNVFELGCYTTSYNKANKPNTIFITLSN